MEVYAQHLYGNTPTLQTRRRLSATFQSETAHRSIVLLLCHPRHMLERMAATMGRHDSHISAHPLALLLENHTIQPLGPRTERKAMLFIFLVVRASPSLVALLFMAQLPYYPTRPVLPQSILKGLPKLALQTD